jgi:hypothetical protein
VSWPAEPGLKIGRLWLHKPSIELSSQRAKLQHYYATKREIVSVIVAIAAIVVPTAAWLERNSHSGFVRIGLPSISRRSRTRNRRVPAKEIINVVTQHTVVRAQFDSVSQNGTA